MSVPRVTTEASQKRDMVMSTHQSPLRKANHLLGSKSFRGLGTGYTRDLGQS